MKPTAFLDNAYRGLKQIFSRLLGNNKKQHQVEDCLHHFLVGSSDKIKVVFSERPGLTASIRRQPGNQYLMEVGREFFQNYLQDDSEGTLFVLLHEIYHRVRGDFTREPLPEEWQYLSNYTMDLFVNSSVFRLTECDPRFLRKFYPVTQVSSCLLRPPLGLLEEISKELPLSEIRELFVLGKGALIQPASQSQFEQVEGLLRKIMESWFQKLGAHFSSELAEMYTSIWIPSLAGSHRCEFRSFFMTYKNVLASILPEMMRIQLVLLGEHNPDPCEESFEQKDNIFAGFNNALKGSSRLGGKVEVEKLALDFREKKSACFELIQALKASLLNSGASCWPTQQIIHEVGFFGRLGRREMTTLAMGYMPRLYQQSIVAEVSEAKSAYVYLDVSGSMSREVLAFLFVALSQLSDLLYSRIFLFSTEIIETSLTEIEQGRFRTTGGTEFDPIVTSAIERNHQKLVVITDGYASLSPEQHDAALKHKLHITTILTDGSDSEHPFCEFGKTFVLPQEES